MSFIKQWMVYGFRVALDNWLLRAVMRFIGAKSYNVSYENTGTGDVDVRI